MDFGGRVIRKQDTKLEAIQTKQNNKMYLLRRSDSHADREWKPRAQGEGGGHYDRQID